jgi:hypothetical protein
VHEPIIQTDAEIFEEEERVSLKLRERLRNSSGGTFLITGFRGVGKTTAVHQALRQLSAPRVISVTVPVARPVATSGLLFEVIRRLVEQLSELGILNSLTPTVRDPLLTAYARTSIAYRETSTKSEEQKRSFGLGGPISAGTPKVTIPLPRWSRTRTRAESLATELSFLAYSEGDVEHDFLRIVDLLGRDDAVSRGRWARLLSRVGIGRATKALDRQIVIVFDEIDKLTEADGGLETFEEMLSGLKNLLAASGVHFIVVGGVDLHDEWLRESATANSLYRSVFAWQGYVGCSWEAARLLVADAAVLHKGDSLEVLADYLEYRGRGIIRNVLHEFNELVEWRGEGPYVELTGTAEDRVRLLGELARILDGVFAHAEGSMLAAPSDHDRLRQASYFTVDWVLRAGRDAFTVSDILDPSRGTPLDSVLQPSMKIVHTVLTALADAGYLEVAARDSEVATQGPESEHYREQYSLSDQLLQRLALIAGASPRARAEFGREKVGPEWSEDTGGDARKALQEQVGGRYEITDRLGSGGFGTVWEARDAVLDKKVALKVIRTPTSEARSRALRESELLTQLPLAGIVQIYDVISTDDRVILVTELIEGESLMGALLPPSTAVAVAIQIAQTLVELHDRRIVHADIKPSNLIIGKEGKPVLVDLGTAQMVEPPMPITRDVTRWGVTGTPAYMAPELFLGEAPGDRSDVWSLGLLLLELLVGKLPHPRTPQSLKKAITSLEVSRELATVLIDALDPDPTSRPSAIELRQRLEETPEGRRGTRPNPKGMGSSETY